MSSAVIFAQVSYSDIRASTPWYEKLFDEPPVRQPKSGLVEWQFSDSAEVRLYEQKEHTGHSMLTLGVLQLEPERKRLQEAGLKRGPIEQTKGYFIMRQTIPTKI